VVGGYPFALGTFHVLRAISAAGHLLPLATPCTYAELERRRETVAELSRKWNELARLEEAEYIAAGRRDIGGVQTPPPTPEDIARMKEINAERQRAFEEALAEMRKTAGPDWAPPHFR